MTTVTAARASRGYLLAWLGALVGAIPAVALPLGIISSSGCTKPGGCGLGGGFIVAGVALTVGFYAAIAGPPVGVYVALRIAGREAAGLTVWFFILAAVALAAINAVVGPALEGGPLDAAWASALAAAIVALPVIGRILALRVADSLRKYR
jgi:hypothetical protein